MVWSTRLEKERKLLRERFPQFTIQGPEGANAGVIGRMTSNAGKEYIIWLELRAFPNTAPGMFIVSPMPLLTHDGSSMASISPNGAMHLLLPDVHGHPQICHYNDRFWLPKVSLFKILMKGRLWIEAYEQHLRFGAPIDRYLGHMS